MDKGYDTTASTPSARRESASRSFPFEARRRTQPAMPVGIGGRFVPRIPRHTQRWRNLSGAARPLSASLGGLKHDYGLAPLRVRGLERVSLHADLVMPARLSQALARARAVPLAA
jgi:hypothetical protein